MDIDSKDINAAKIVCLPGQKLCIYDETTILGPGTYERRGYICANLAGTVNIIERDMTKYVHVKPAGKQAIVPIPNDIVTAKIVLVNQRFAKCSIICIGKHILNRTYRAILRREEVRATEKDRIDMYRSFRPNDIILARVLPQTEISCYQLSTAENELGVVVALSSENGPYGLPMVPVSWTEMQCPDTLVKETRKVAKVVSESDVKEEYKK